MASESSSTTQPVLLQGPAAASYPVISVVDHDATNPAAPVVVWHVHLGPDTITGRLNGAWVLGGDVSAFPTRHDAYPDVADTASVDDDLDDAEEALDSGDGNDAADTAAQTLFEVAAGDDDDHDAADIAQPDDEEVLEATRDERSDEQKLESLIRGTHVVVSDRTDVNDPLIAPALERVLSVGDIDSVRQAAVAGVDEINQAILDEVEARKRARRQEKQDTGKMTTPLLAKFEFGPIPEVDAAAFADSFRGETYAREAFIATKTVAAIVDHWLDIESARRRRRYLKDRFGEHPRAIPLPDGNDR